MNQLVFLIAWGKRKAGDVIDASLYSPIVTQYLIQNKIVKPQDKRLKLNIELK